MTCCGCNGLIDCRACALLIFCSGGLTIMECCLVVLRVKIFHVFKFVGRMLNFSGIFATVW